MKRPLKKCCNGCDAPPHPPSWVLCKECFEKLCGKVEELRKTFGQPAPARPAKTERP
jgi:hypothetical protein